LAHHALNRHQARGNRQQFGTELHSFPLQYFSDSTSANQFKSRA
jgi:hypothetical protein